MSCSFPACPKPLWTAGLCRGHYEQRRRGKELTKLRDRRVGQKTLSEISDLDLMWLAGLFEGEAYFCPRTPINGSYGNRVIGPRIQLKMTDQDVVERVQTITGSGSVRYKAEKAENRKDVWIWNLSGSNAVTLMTKLLPFMGERRATKIKEILHGAER